MKCKVDGCGEESKTRGFCLNHRVNLCNLVKKGQLTKEEFERLSEPRRSGESRLLIWAKKVLDSSAK